MVAERGKIEADLSYIEQRNIRQFFIRKYEIVSKSMLTLFAAAL